MSKFARWLAPAAAIASGLLAGIIVPPGGQGYLVWICLMPLLYAAGSVAPRRAGLKGFALGTLAGAIASGFHLTWMAVVSPLGAVALPVYLGLFWGAFGAIAATIANSWRDPTPTVKKSLLTAFVLAAIWGGLEVLRGCLFTGFGWNNLGVAFHQNLLIAQNADLLGVSGLSALAVFVQAVVIQAARRLASRRSAIPWDAAAAAGAILLAIGYGTIRIRTEEARETFPLKTLMVQINIPQSAAIKLWEPEEMHVAYEQDTLAALAAAGEPGDPTWPDWVIWPESALPGYFFRADDGAWDAWNSITDSLEMVRSPGPFTMIFGTNEAEAVKAGDSLDLKPDGRVFNSLAVLTPDEELQTFRKQHLVIFGETIPFVESIPLLKKIYEQQAGTEYRGSFSAGDSFEPLLARAGGHEIGIIPTVCFEDTVPRLLRHFVRPSPQVIVNVTNDGWFKESPAAAQHYANAIFRAIEIRRPMLRCANSGVSAAISSTGSTLDPRTGAERVIRDANGNHFTRKTLISELPIPQNPALSLYSIVGDWGLGALSLAGLGLALVNRPRPEKPCRSH